MNILVLNGSPKGKYSVTLQTSRYLELKNPQHTFLTLNIGSMTRSLEKDFTPARQAIEQADILLFSYPVYTFIAPYQVHRFIELLKQENVDLSGKVASQITTSKHFYDVTAHRYVQQNCDDLGIPFVRGLSADMDDLLTEKGQKQAQDFFDYLMWSIENRCFEPVSLVQAAYSPVPATPLTGNEDKEGNVVIITDCKEDNRQLANMIARFQAVLPRKTRVINLWEFPFKGGCLGCFNCAVTGKCVYTDGFDEYLRREIQTAQSIVYAFTISDHSMGARFKLYDDRQFCNGHRTVTVGMPVGYLVSGAYNAEQNLQMIVEGRAQVGQNFLAGIATDERDTDAAIDQLANTLEYAISHRYVPPQNFYGIGGMKIFRDLIWLMQGMMKADHKFYKANGHYDFPQKRRGMMLKMYLVGALLSSPKIKAKMGNAMNEGMLMPYNKLLESLKK